MKRLALLLFLAATPAVAQHAQTPADTTGRAHGRFNHQRAARLKEALDLTDDQAAKLRSTETKFMEQRRAIMQRSRTVSQALRAQLRPGVAANADSVRKLLDASDENAGALMQLRRDERRELATYLTPVQQARFQLIRQRAMGRFGRFRGHRGGRGWQGHGRGHGWGDGDDGSGKGKAGI